MSRIPALFHLAMRALRDAGAAQDRGAHAFFVPGRIEVLGKHTDYAGGRSLLAAVDRGFVIIAIPRDDDRVTIADAVEDERVELRTSHDDGAVEGERVKLRTSHDDGAVEGERVELRTSHDDGAVEDEHVATPTSHGDDVTRDTRLWVRYPQVVLDRMRRNFPDARGGADLAFASDLPAAAGLSSSSALVTAVFLALGAVRGVGSTAAYARAIASDADLAGYLGAVENGLDFGPLGGGAGVGTMGGSEDHTAILCARADRLVQYSFAPVRFERDVPMPPGHVFVVATSGVRAEKAGGARAAYNHLSAQTQALEAAWHRAGAGAERMLGDIVAAGPDAVDRLRALVHDDIALARRLDQFVAESTDIIPSAADALQHGDLAAFGEQVARSQQLAEDVLGNQIAETRALVRLASRHGAVAASAFGGGFGGSVWALMPHEHAATFAYSWREAYSAAFPQHADACTVFVSPAAAAATRL
jgi:galactokinase